MTKTPIYPFSSMAIVRNIQNGDLYRFHGGLTFENLRTGVKGEMPEDKAREFLKINSRR